MRRLASRVLIGLLVLGLAIGTRPAGRRPEARRHADHRPAHGSRLARPEPRDHRARRLGLLQHARGAADARRQDAGQALAGDVVRGDVAHQGALQAAPRREVPRRHAVQRRGREVHVRPRAQGHAARALGQPGRLARRRRGGGRPHRRHRHQGALRPDPPHPGHVLHGHRVADGRAEDGRRLQPGPGRHRAVQVRGVEDQHPRDHRAEQRLLGRQGPRRPRDLQGRPRGRRADDRAADGRRRHGAVPLARPAPGPAQGSRSSRSTRRRASAWSSRACTPGMPPLDDVRVRQALLHAVDRKAILDNIMEGSAGPALGVLAPGVFGYKDMQLDKLYPFDRAKAKALLAQAGWTPGPDGIMQKGGQRAVAVVAGRARPLSQGRRDHRGDPGDVQGGRRRGQGAGPGVGRGVPAGARPIRSTTTCSRWAG